MLGTQRSRCAADATRGHVGTQKQLPSSEVRLYDSGIVTEDSLFADGKIYPMINPFNQTGLERFFGTFSID
jgi:hypothetical protein